MLLSTDIWVGALIRRAEAGGAFAAVVRKGDARAGAVLVKVLNRPAGTARLYAEATRMDGERIWMQPAPSDQEPDLDAYIEHRPDSADALVHRGLCHLAAGRRDQADFDFDRAIALDPNACERIKRLTAGF